MLNRFPLPRSFWRLLLLVLLSGILHSVFETIKYLGLSLYGESLSNTQDPLLDTFISGYYEALLTGVFLFVGAMIGGRIRGYRLALSWAFSLMLLAIVLGMSMNGIAPIWISSLALFSTAYGLALVKLWHRAGLYFPWASLEKYAALVLVATTLFISSLVANLTYILLFWSGLMDDRSLAIVLLGIVVAVLALYIARKDQENEFSVDLQSIDHDDKLDSSITGGSLVLLALMAWAAYAALPTGFYSYSEFGSFPELVRYVLLPIGLLIGALFFLSRAGNQLIGMPILLYLLGGHVILMAIRWIPAVNESSWGEPLTLLHSIYLQCGLQSFLFLLILHRWISRPYIWLGGLLAAWHVIIFVDNTVYPFSNTITFLLLFSAFGALLIGLRDNQGIIRELFQLDEAAFEVQAPEDEEPDDDISEHLIEP